MESVRALNYALTLSCLFGLALSIYAFYVEQAVEEDSNYEAMCDISEKMSCTKAFTSEYGKGFGIVARLLGEDSSLNKPNSLLGILFYSLIATLAQTNLRFVTKLAFYAVILSNVASVYFAYILYFILHDLCIVCVSTYVVNFVNLLLLWKKNSLLLVNDSDRKKKRN